MKIALIGFGVVGQGFLQILVEKGAELLAQTGFQPQIVGVTTGSRGSLFHPDGLSLAHLITAGVMTDYPDAPGLQRNLSSLDLIQTSNADVIVEISPTNLRDGEPALSHIRAALASGKHVVTANKGPLALAYPELAAEAKSKGLFFGYEATVMSGTPALRLAQEALRGCTISEVRGILNGTTNYILTQMELGQSYTEALTDAQALGYAESDPSADVEGWDTLSKVLILATTLLGEQVRVEDAYVRGITHLSLDDVIMAQQRSQRWKLVGYARREEGKLVVGVEPMRLPISDALAGVSGVMNAITYSTDLLGDVTLVGRGAGGQPTGFGLLSDLLALHRQKFGG